MRVLRFLAMLETMRKGIATPIMLIVLLVTFSSLIAATSYMALGALKGNAIERATYQAFLIAESALDAFPLLSRAEDCVLPSRYELKVNNATYTASYTIQPVTSQQIPALRVEARATLGGATARVARDFRRCGFPLSIPAALTSRPRIEVRGNATVIGEDFFSNTGKLLVGKTNTATTVDSQFNVEVDNATYIPANGYLEMDSRIYRVRKKEGNTLTLEPVFPLPEGTSLTIAANTPVYLVEYGVTSYVAPSTLTLTQVDGLVEQQVIRISLNGQEYVGEITHIDHVNKSITVSWTTNNNTPPPLDIPEGTPLIPQVVGAASNLNIDVRGGGEIKYGIEENSSMVPTDPNNLFFQVFHMSKEGFRRIYPPVPPTSFTGTLKDWEVVVVEGNLMLTGNTGICGKGVLVVFGNLTINTNQKPCDEGFQGIIYVAGDYDQQGNASISGAVVVEGVANLQQCNGNDCWTNISGTQKNTVGKIEFNRGVIHTLRMLYGGQGEPFTPLYGTWRRL